MQVEDAINKLRLPRVDEDMNEERVINTIVKYYVDPAAKMKDFYLNKISKRCVHEWLEIGKCLHRHKSLKQNVHALIALFVLNGGPKLKAAVSSEVSPA